MNVDVLKFKNTVLFPILIGLVFFVWGCPPQPKSSGVLKNTQLIPLDTAIVVGANQTERYLKLLQNKRVGIVANQTSVIFKTTTSKPISYTHIVDSLLSLGITIQKVFAPEHGFRGTADAGEVVKDGRDTKTRLPIISLYGSQKKPSNAHLKDIDILIFDIQDVGARFYTYISTLHYVMEACAEHNIPLLVLDRPNPNGHYIDGPVLELQHKSFVGMHPVPVVHGLTIGEYAQLINGEGWLNNGVVCDITVITMKHYTHRSMYSLPIKPSPNLPNDVAINLYPSLCFFEGTNVSIGRGTDKQFQVVGSPFFHLKQHYFEFTPQPNSGAKYPKHQDNICYGYDLSGHKRLNRLNIAWLIEFYNANAKHATTHTFFTSFFIKLAGTTHLQEQIEANKTETEIRASWQDDLEAFKTLRQQYVLYP